MAYVEGEGVDQHSNQGEEIHHKGGLPEERQEENQSLDSQPVYLAHISRISHSRLLPRVYGVHRYTERRLEFRISLDM